MTGSFNVVALFYDIMISHRVEFISTSVRNVTKILRNPITTKYNESGNTVNCC